MNLQENIQRIREMMGVDESFLDWFKSPKTNNNDEDILKSEEERFTCADCGEKDYKMYMVNDDSNSSSILFKVFGGNLRNIILM